MPFDNTNAPESATTRLLRNARAVITDEEKWIAGHRSYNGRHCALGALDVAMNYKREDEHYWSAIELLGKYATYRRHDTYNFRQLVTDWSDPHSKIAAHNNVLGHKATLEMFDNAIAESVANDMAGVR